MNDQDHKQILHNIISTVLNLHKETNFNNTTKLVDLCVDDLDIVEIVMGIEDETGINIYEDGEDWINSRIMELTVGDILKKLNEN